MEQTEFNAMLMAALSYGLPSGYYTSRYNGEETDNAITKISQITRRNLLDNWYFAGPINQRGNTEYPSAGYTIDRWRSNGGTTTIGAGGLSVTAGNVLYQLFENINLADGIKRTVSYMDTDGNVYSGILTSAYALYGQYEFCYSTGTALYIRPRAGASPIAAIKLELGDQQTLASKAVDGTWTLIDPPPNKAEELAKCQRYCLVVSPNNSYAPAGSGMVYTTTSARIIIPTPVSLRVNPSVLYTGAWQLLANGASQTVNAMSLAGSSSVAVQIDATTSGLVVGQGVVMRSNNDSTAKIILSADL